MPEILRQKLGDDGAQALADVLNKVTVPRVELDSKLDTIINKIDSLRNELKAEIRTECAKVRFQTFAWTFGLFITLLATLYTLLK
jgi:aspartate/tyrosine/aromatic aminotransferase